MNDRLQQKLKAQFADSIISINEYRGELTVVVKTSDIMRVCQFLRDDEELQFDSLRDICGTDYSRPDDRFEVVYNIYSLKNNFRLRLKVRVDEAHSHVPTVIPVWSGANWYERETYDMYGIVFDEHPDLRRIYMPEEFEHYPLRKDFPLMGIPGSLSLPRK